MSDNNFGEMIKKEVSRLATQSTSNHGTNRGMVLEQYMEIMGSMLGPMGGGQFSIPIFDLLSKPPVKQKVRYDERVKFSYYGRTGHCNNHKGVIVVATYVDEESRVVYYGTAFCSPKDVYDKAKGKKIAFDDLNANMTTIALTKKNHHAVNAGVFADIFATGSFPSWAREMVVKNTIRHLKESSERAWKTLR